MTFEDLTPERHERLVQHFMSEFNESREVALAACQQLDGADLEIHLEAAEYGYI